jgi:hypothetical protein
VASTKLLAALKQEPDLKRMGRSALKRALKKELEKMSADRSYLKDLLAGIDPTGSKTFTYGIKDASKSDREKAVRLGLGVAGGILGGAVLVPSVVAGIIESAAQASKGPRAMLRGFGAGFLKPVVGAVRGVQTVKALGRAAKGEALTAKEVGRAASFGKILPITSPLAGKSGKLLPVAEANLKQMDAAFDKLRALSHGKAEHLEKLHTLRKGTDMIGNLVRSAPRTGSRRVDRLIRDVQSDVRNLEKGVATAEDVAVRLRTHLPEIERQYLKSRGLTQQGLDAAKAINTGKFEAAATHVNKLFSDPGVRAKLPGIQAETMSQLKKVLAGLALSGAVGGGSAALQYMKGSEMGKILTPAQRKKL